MEVDLEEFRQSIIDSYINYTSVMCNFDISWCEDGIRRAKEAKTIQELEKIDEVIEKAWDNID